MDKTQILIFVLIMSVAAFRLYQKYGKKNTSSGAENNIKNSGSGFSGGTDKDDYEPYSKK